MSIVFDGLGQMEVDFLCIDHRIVSEVNGAQHLDDKDAYRRDQHKDMLLQEQGYLVLRFLAQDIGKRLDVVLDTILKSVITPSTNTTTTPIASQSDNWKGFSKLPHGY